MFILKWVIVCFLGYLKENARRGFSKFRATHGSLLQLRGAF